MVYVNSYSFKYFFRNGENRNRTCEGVTPSRFQGGVLDQPDSLLILLQSPIYEPCVFFFVLATQYLDVTIHPYCCWVDKSLA